MKRVALLLVLALVVASCASTTPPFPTSQDLVSRAVKSMGGADRLAGIKTISLKGTLRQWEPEQSKIASGPLRFACESTFEMVADTGARSARTDWVRKFAYPAPRTFTYGEIVTPEIGYVAGIDSNGRTKQSLDSTPPAHNMSSLRLTATQRELQRASPLLFLDMQRNASRLSTATLSSVGTVTYPTVDYRVGTQTFTVMFDSTTGLPARIRTLDYDNMWGDVTYDLVLSDWQTFDGVRIATTQRYELAGWQVAEVKLTDVRLNAPVAAERLAVPAAFTTGASRPATGAVPYQWVIRRQFIGTYLDSDVPSYDTRATMGLRLVELAPGVQHVTGGSHHSLLVEMRDHLVVFDAPVSDWQSNWVLNAARAKYPNKPVKFLVLTHHHMDHAGGLRAYAAQGAALVVGQGTAAHYRRVLARPFTRNPDLPARDLSKTEIIEVTDKRVFSDGQQTVEAYVIENPHADGLLIGYVPTARLGFVTDIWSPGAGALPDKLNPNLAAVVAGVKKAGISPEKFAGGHGSVADYAPLAALEGK
jgi:glyoxylase-like metal-dependent hydrolase (beta-lactamase superfamily II)